jgi:hypothetical protein
VADEQNGRHGAMAAGTVHGAAGADRLTPTVPDARAGT